MSEHELVVGAVVAVGLVWLFVALVRRTWDKTELRRPPRAVTPADWRWP